MSSTMRGAVGRLRGLRPVLPVLALVCLALPGLAAATEVTVRVEGEFGNLVKEQTVTIGNGSGWAQKAPGSSSTPALASCKDNTAYQAIELATGGDWDRAEFAKTIKKEKHEFAAGEEYWVPYYNNNYGDWGTCQQKLKNGDTVLMQAAVSGPFPTYIPDSVPIAIDSVEPGTEVVEIGTEVTVHLTEWKPTDIFGEEDPEFPGEHWIIPPSPATDAAGYTVVAGGTSAVTNGLGNATLTLEEPGPVQIEAYVPASPTNWSRAVPVEVCVDDFEPGTC